MANKQTNTFEINGKVVDLEGPQVINDSLTKRTLKMEVMDGRYNNVVPFEFHNHDIQQLANIKKGDWVLLQFKLKARPLKSRTGEVTGKTIITLQGMRCNKD